MSEAEEHAHTIAQAFKGCAINCTSRGLDRTWVIDDAGEPVTITHRAPTSEWDVRAYSGRLDTFPSLAVLLANMAEWNDAGDCWDRADAIRAAIRSELN
jgi:hypothetical protein